MTFTIEQLEAEVASGSIDTILIAFPDMQGRLQGKRFDAGFFLEEVRNHGTEACSYLLAVDVEMGTVPGYRMSSWDQGYHDFGMQPDLLTLRRVPWHPATALLLADLHWNDGSPVAAAPRHVLRCQCDRLAARGWQAMVGTELEFIVFRDTYEDANRKGYAGLEPANQYNVDYSLLGTSRIEPFLRRIRNEMTGAGLQVESAKGECNLGQHEIVFRFDNALATCDKHVLYKLGAKEIAAQEGMSLTFMAKYDQREGNSCHIHFSIRSPDAQPVFALEDTAELSQIGEQFLAGVLAGMCELTLLFAPNINSYKRYVEGSFAPTAIRWGRDNRTCAIRVVGRGASLRFENRVPGGDVNPYLACAAMIAAGLDGVERGLPLEAAFVGNAYQSESQRLPRTLRDALELWHQSRLAREAFGAEVVDHYANMALVELTAYDRTVTDWERVRGFERL